MDQTGLHEGFPGFSRGPVCFQAVRRARFPRSGFHCGQLISTMRWYLVDLKKSIEAPSWIKHLYHHLNAMHSKCKALGQWNLAFLYTLFHFHEMEIFFLCVKYYCFTFFFASLRLFIPHSSSSERDKHPVWKSSLSEQFMKMSLFLLLETDRKHPQTFVVSAAGAHLY